MRAIRGRVIAGALMAITIVFSTAAAAAASSMLPSRTARLEEQVAAGRLAPEVLTSIRDRGHVDAFVAFENSETLSQAVAKAAPGEGRAAAVLAVTQPAYQAFKERLLASLGDQVSVLRSYVAIPSMFIRFHSERALTIALAHPTVRGVGAGKSLRPQLTESLPLIEQPVAAWVGQTGAGASIAVLDSGVDYTQSPFNCSTAGSPGCRVVVSRDCSVAGSTDCSLLVDGSDRDTDPGLHGTKMAAIAGRVAPEANIVALDVFRPGSANDGERLADLEDAIDWAIQNQARYNIRALNMSLGVDTFYATRACGGSTDTLQGALRDARAVGILPVASAGNVASPGTDSRDNFVAGIGYPACLPEVVSVGATYDAEQPDGVWQFSDCTDRPTETNPVPAGPNRVACFSQTAPILTVLAPGAFINALGRSESGTSEAAAHVSGAVAVLARAVPYKTVDEIQAAIANSGPLIRDTRPEPDISKRRLNVKDALLALDGTNPAVTRAPWIVLGEGLQLRDTEPAIPVSVFWWAGDIGSGLSNRFIMDKSINGGPWVRVSSPDILGYARPNMVNGQVVCVATVALAPGNNYRLRVSVMDGVGRWSPWVESQSRQLNAFQEGSATYTGSWIGEAGDSYYGGGDRATAVRDSRARFTFTGRDVAWVSQRGRYQGRADVYVDGSYVRTIDLYHDHVIDARRVVFRRSFSSPGTHVLEIRVAGSGTYGSAVHIDAFLVIP